MSGHANVVNEQLRMWEEDDWEDDEEGAADDVDESEGEGG
jgi:hypothetical protein